jgi:glycosyltransferase involved in cell wall biosynthesis
VADTSSRVLVLSLSELTLDARIRRQVEFLASYYSVLVGAPGKPLDISGVEFVELRSTPTGRVTRAAQAAKRVGLRLSSRYERAYWLGEPMQDWRERLRQAGPYDAIVVNDLWALPLALAVSDGTPVVFDAHEHWTSESASWGRWQRLSMRGAHEWILEREVPRTAAMMTVSRGIARDYERRLDVRPALVTNAPFHQSLTPTPVGEPIRLVHAGIADERRRLEDTIDVVRSLGERFSLDLVLVHDNPYRRRLERLVTGEDRIRILPPVPTRELIAFENAYDVGVYLQPADFPNQVHSLPNKLFDYIQARLAVAIGPTPEMAAIVEEWGCGVVSESFEPDDFAAALHRLGPEDIERMKQNAHRAAAVLTAESNRETVLDLVARAMSGSFRPSVKPAAPPAP